MAVASASPIAAPARVPIRRIGGEDIRFALREGFADFRTMRGDILVVALLYPLFSLGLAFMSLGGMPLILFFPMAAGLSLMGPLVAAGFYELARRREEGRDASWRHFLDVRHSPSIGAIAGVAVAMIALFGSWVWVAGAIHDFYLTNVAPPSVGAFLRQLFGTREGWTMMIVGDLVGAGYAVAALILTWVTLPMLVDRPVNGWVAIGASVRAVAANPLIAARWGLTVAVLLVAGALPAFVGLAVVIPWLGYATWHLYTRIVDRGALPERPESRPSS